VATFIFSNNAATTLAGPIAATATTINVAAGTGALFPTPAVGQQFSVTLVSATDNNVREITYCTSRVGDTLSVLRGQEGTTATAFSAGDTAANDLTAGACASFLQIIPTPPPTPTPTPTPPPPQAFLNYYGTDFGTTNSIRVTLNPQQPGSLSLLIGSPILILVANTNTGPTILTITGLPSTTVFAQGGSTSSLPAGSIVGGQIYQFTYLSGIGFEVSTPRVLLSTPNTWSATQTIGNSLTWSGNNTSGTSQKLIGVDSNNQTATYAGPSGAAAWRIVSNNGGSTFVAVGSNGAVSVNNSINVTGGATTDNLNVTNVASVQNGLNVAGGSHTTGGATTDNLNVTNVASVQNGLNVAGGVRISTGGLNIIQSGFNVTGDSTLQNKLTVAGAASLNGTLQVGGSASLNSSASVGGGLNVAGTLGVAGGAILQSTLGVSGDTSLSGRLTIQGNANFNQSMTLAGGMNINGTLGVAGGAVLESTLLVVGTCTAHAFVTSSDYRLKVTFGRADVGDIIDAVPVYEGEFKSTHDYRNAMFLAHEMALGVPHAVRGVKDGPEIQTIDLPSLVPYLWAEIQSLRRRIKLLEEKHVSR